MAANPAKPRGALAKTADRKARPGAEGERRTARRRAPRLRKEACKTKDRRATRHAVPSLPRKGGHFQNLGRIRAARITEHVPNDDPIEPVTEDTIAREEAKLTPEDLERIRKALQLWRAQMLCLWKICPKAACRRTHDCSVDPDFCVERFAALVSEDVHVALDVLHDAKYFGYSYDDACALAPPRQHRSLRCVACETVSSGIRPHLARDRLMQNVSASASPSPAYGRNIATRGVPEINRGARP